MTSAENPGGDYFLFNGVGAGNIGDEAMFQGWAGLYPLEAGDVMEVWNTAAVPQTVFNPSVTCVRYDQPAVRGEHLRRKPRVLLAGDTPVMEMWGLGWPLQFHSAALKQCFDHGATVHAIGVGVDRITGNEARSLFAQQHSRISDWTVRTNACRESLIDLGVPADSVRVAADLAWLYQPAKEARAWAEGYLQSLNVSLSQPLAAVNCVSEIWAGNEERLNRTAALLETFSSRCGVTLLFLCNETRAGEYFDHDFHLKLSKKLRCPHHVVPNQYFSPDQMAGLLSCCLLSLSQRYHFSLLSAAAGVPTAVFSRGDKLRGLSAELDAPVISDMAVTDPDASALRAEDAWRSREVLLQRQSFKRTIQGVKALHAGSFLDAARPRIAGLASMNELNSAPYKNFMTRLNAFARQLGLMEMVDWSKVWEYPWLWLNALNGLDWRGAHLVDLGSELSPMPWFIASLGARVTMVEVNSSPAAKWAEIRDRLKVDVSWHIVGSEAIPVETAAADAVTSFSVIEHQKSKSKAVAEVARILKPGGTFAVSFDICEPELGMTFPEWNGRALTLQEFEKEIWLHPAFGNTTRPEWNRGDMSEFKAWHLKSAPHHNYVVGAAVLKKKE